MNSITVFLDIGGTILDTPDIFEILTSKLVSNWPDMRTYELVLEIHEGVANAIIYKEEQHPFQNIVDVIATVLASLAEKHGYRNISDQARDIFSRDFSDTE